MARKLERFNFVNGEPRSKPPSWENPANLPPSILLAPDGLPQSKVLSEDGDSMKESTRQPLGYNRPESQ
jgi:hypothetical protein